LQQSDQLYEAADFYERAVVASSRPAASELDPQKKVLVRLAAGAVLTQVNHLTEAIEALRPALASDSAASESQKEIAVTILLRVGAAALAIGDPGIASQAYALARDHADEGQRATAELGEAWAMAIQRSDPLAAARKLADFIDRYPDHVDASRAARACAECLKQCDRAEDSSAMLADLLHRWPDSESAWEVVASHRDLPIDLVPTAIQRWLIESAETDRLKHLDVSMIVQGLMAASQERERNAWVKLAQQLASIDESGQSTSDLLAKLSETSKNADAERLATILIAPTESGSVQAGAREAACRWAGRTQRWSMLALASESENLSKSDPSRTIAVERLFAESLMQVTAFATSRSAALISVTHRSRARVSSSTGSRERPAPPEAWLRPSLLARAPRTTGSAAAPSWASPPWASSVSIELMKTQPSLASFPASAMSCM